MARVAPERQDQAAFERILEGFGPEIHQLAMRTRGLILDVLPGAFEVVWERQRTVGYGTGPKKMTEHFAWIAPAKAHVGLGFFYGTELPDPEGLLEGTGKLLRHVKVRSEQDLENPALRTLLERAVKHRVPQLPEER